MSVEDKLTAFVFI